MAEPFWSELKAGKNWGLTIDPVATLLDVECGRKTTVLVVVEKLGIRTWCQLRVRNSKL